MCLFLGQEIALKGGHTLLVERWRYRSAPQIPEQVLTILFQWVVVRCIIRGTDVFVYRVEQLTAFIINALDVH